MAEIKGYRCLKCGAELCHEVGAKFEATIQQHELDQANKHKEECGGEIELFTLMNNE